MAGRGVGGGTTGGTWQHGSTAARHQRTAPVVPTACSNAAASNMQQASCCCKRCPATQSPASSKPTKHNAPQGRMGQWCGNNVSPQRLAATLGGFDRVVDHDGVGDEATTERDLHHHGQHHHQPPATTTTTATSESNISSNSSSSSSSAAQSAPVRHQRHQRKHSSNSSSSAAQSAPVRHNAVRVFSRTFHPHLLDWMRSARHTPKVTTCVPWCLHGETAARPRTCSSRGWLRGYA